MMETALLDAATRLFDKEFTPGARAALENGADPAPLWARLSAAGLPDALRPEALGGVGLSWGGFFALARAAGEHALPLPLVETALLRALLEAPPEGAIALAPQVAGRLCPRVPHGAVADWLALEAEGRPLLVPLAGLERVRRGLDADITLPETLAQALPLPPGIALEEIGALAQAARIAGALMRVLALSVAHVTTREQFSRKLAGFQAIQHQLAQLAEATHLASLACEMGFAGGPPARGALLPALAKARCSALAPQGAAIAHAVHGAMGIAAEFPLQHYTRALHAARLAFGASGYWEARLGAALLAQDGTSGTFIDTHLTPAL